MRRLLAPRRVPEMPVLEALPAPKFGDVGALRGALEHRHGRLVTFLRRVLEYVDQTTREAVDQLNTQVQGIGPDIVSDTTVQVTHAIHRVSGSAAIDTIELPAEARGLADETTTRSVTSFTGPLWLISSVGSTWTIATGGNIKAAASPAAGHHVALVYDGENWWPA